MKYCLYLVYGVLLFFPLLRIINVGSEANVYRLIFGESFIQVILFQSEFIHPFTLLFVLLGLIGLVFVKSQYRTIILFGSLSLVLVKLAEFILVQPVIN